ncbi:MAG: nucleotide exchange factor GrpE [Clostridia bacterium]|nr:nucleotide exchange factor GrpE [Clostridia bacterium]
MEENVKFEEATNPKADSGFGEAVEEEAAAPAKETKGSTPKEGKESKKSKSKTKELEAALAASEDKYLRLCAEYENFRKRSRAEREGVYAEAYADAIKELLPILDNLERATQYTAPDKVAEGVELILKSLPDVFAKMKVTVYGKAGEQFDPNIHNAVMHIEDSAYGENEIVDVFQQGYMLGDKVIRYAMVRVAN